MIHRTALSIALSAALLTPYSATNASEIRISVGKNYGILIPEEPGGIGSWRQYGLDNQIENGKPMAAVQYVGDTGLSWLPYTIGVAYRNGAVASGEYVSDGCYVAKVFSGALSGTPGYCDRRYYAKSVKATTMAVTAALTPTWHATKDFALFTSIGVSLHSSTIKMQWDNTRGMCAGNLCPDATFKDRAISPYAELGFRYKRVSLTTYYAPSERAPESMASGNTGVMFGWSIPLN